VQQTRRDILPIDAAIELRRELVAHLRENRTGLREEWVRRITDARLLRAMTNEEVFAEATSVSTTYVEARALDLEKDSPTSTGSIGDVEVGAVPALRSIRGEIDGPVSNPRAH
jgi:hypothetical protein